MGSFFLSRIQGTNMNFFVGEIKRTKGDNEVLLGSIAKQSIRKLACIEELLTRIKVKFDQELRFFIRVGRFHYRLQALWAVGLQMKLQIDKESKRKLDIFELGHRMKFITKKSLSIFEEMNAIDSKNCSPRSKDLFKYALEFANQNFLADIQKYPREIDWLGFNGG